MRTSYYLLASFLSILTANNFLNGQTEPQDSVYAAARLDAANAFYQKGRVFYFSSNPREALIWYDSALQIRSQYLPADHLDIAQLYNNIGLAKAQLGYIREAIEFHEKSLRIRLDHLPPGHEMIGHSLANLGQAYGFAHEPEKSIDYSLQALALLIPLPQIGPKHPNVAFINNNLAGAYLYKEEWDKALDCLQKALDISGAAAPPEIHSNIGAAYFKMKRYQESLAYFQKVESEFSITSPENPALPSLWTNIGSAYQLMGQNAEAEHWHRKALSLSRKLFGEKHPAVARDFQNTGSDRYLQDDVAGALALFDSARVASDIADQNFRLVSNPELHFAIESASTEACLKAFFLTGDPANLERAIRITLALDQFTDDIRPNYTGNHARRYLQQLAKFQYERGIYACHLLWQQNGRDAILDTVFFLMEKSKGLALYGAMQAAKALKISGIPDSLLQQEQKLRADLANVEKRYWAAQLKKSDLTTLNGEAATLRMTYDSLLHWIALKYPRYDSLCFNLPVRNVNDIRRRYVPDGTTLLQYFEGDTSLYVLVLRTDTLILREIAKTFPLEANINGLLDGITGYPLEETEIGRKKKLELYVRTARLLYDSLIAPVATFLDSQIIIIPDGRLARIPFEALLTEVPVQLGRLYEFPYFLHRHYIRYAYSATLLDEMSASQAADEHFNTDAAFRDFTGFAPWYRPASGKNRRDSTKWLESSGEEIRQIASRFSISETFLSSQASVAQFKIKAGKSSIFHISSHAWADDRGGEFAFITFAPQKTAEQSNLFLGDIYNLTLPAKMAVLSACETNIGKLSKGEGVLSLTRAFAYAGTKSIVSSLWKVNDPATKELMITFYQNLIPTPTQGGKLPKPNRFLPKDIALQKAKVELVKSKSAWSHPYYWAGFVLIGDNAPLR